MSYRIFIGVDERQPIAYNVAQFSLWQNASRPVSVTPLVLSQLPITRRGLTTFTFSRYLVPWLCGFEGKALFMDADTLVRGDIVELFEMDLGVNAVSVVPHTVVQKNGQDVSVHFERNAVMLFDCALCPKLTPEYIDNLGNSPNRISEWAESIGELPKEWNHLVGYDKPNPAAKIAHFTMGIPCFPETKDDEFADEWRESHRQMNGTVPWADIMGNSVHAKWKR